MSARRVKPVAIRASVKLRAYAIIDEAMDSTVRGMFRAAAKYTALDPHGELTPEQHSRAQAHVMNVLCELLDFGGDE